MDLKDKVKLAIEQANHHKKIHEKWLDYVTIHTNYDGDAGDIQHHKDCIERYDLFLEIFEEFSKKL